MTQILALVLLPFLVGDDPAARPASAPATAQPAATPIAPAVAKAMARITAEDLRKDLTFIAADERGGRATPSQGQHEAALYLEARFREIGLAPGGGGTSFLQPVPVPARRSRRNAEEPEPKGDGAAPKPELPEPVNVIGILKGRDPAAGAVVISAHYDHIGTGKPNEEGDGIYNGADDDGSGTVAVVALARAFSALEPRPQRTVVFACFTGEETGGFGSNAYVTSPPVPLAETLCDVNLEMLGRTHGVGAKRTWLTGWEFSTLGPILARHATGAGVELFPDPYPEQRYYMRSDNMAFVRKNVIGHSLSAGSTHPDYHGVDDEVDRIEFDNLESLVRGIFLGVAAIASGAETPKPTGASLLPERTPRRR